MRWMLLPHPQPVRLQTKEKVLLHGEVDVLRRGDGDGLVVGIFALQSTGPSSNPTFV